MDKVNQQVLADRLGLSRATVSRCFTNHRAINPETRARVFALAAEIGYRYMEMRTPRVRKIKGAAVGVLICYPAKFTEKDVYENPGQKILGGVSELAQLRDLHLDVHYVDPRETTLEGASYRRISALRHGRWHGALLIYPFAEAVIDSLLQRVPCVSLVEQEAHTELDCVDVDHYRGISKIIDLLFESGHRRIGFFSAHYVLGASWAMHRFSAYVEKMMALKLEYRPEHVINVLPRSAMSQEDALERMRELTAAGVTAWVCAGDYAAYSAIAELTAHGVNVPEEVSVTGFDGIKPPRGRPQVTTLEIPFREIGITGARRLVDLIKAPFDRPQHILLGCKLRHGQTVGRCGR